MLLKELSIQGRNERINKKISIHFKRFIPTDSRDLINKIKPSD